MCFQKQHFVENILEIIQLTEKETLQNNQHLHEQFTLLKTEEHEYALHETVTVEEKRGLTNSLPVCT